MFKEFDDPKERRRLKTALRDAELGVKRSELEAKNELDKADADVTAKKIRKEMQEEELNELAEHASNMTMKAQEHGLIIYNTRRRHWQTPVEVSVGEKIARHQQLMIIPDMTSLQVKTKVLETVSRLVGKGLDAYIRLDAFSDKVYEGRVHWIAPQAGAQHWFDPTVKVHEVVVKFDEYPSDIKPKMTGKVEIIIANLPNALQVPMAAVFAEQETTYVWRVGAAGRPEKVEVKVGLSNEAQVQIKGGLNEGDEVLLVPEDGMEPALEKEQPIPDSPGGPDAPMGGGPGE
ncbi:MAG: efflux RND transporter periplasmic adaptor subunit, partial [Phycisphaerae bacterium]